MRLVNGFNAAFYLNTVDDKGRSHHYRMTPAETTQLVDETVVDFYPSSFKFSQIISDESARKLWLAVKGK